MYYSFWQVCSEVAYDVAMVYVVAVRQLPAPKSFYLKYRVFHTCSVIQREAFCEDAIFSCTAQLRNFKVGIVAFVNIGLAICLL